MTVPRWAEKVQDKYRRAHTIHARYVRMWAGMDPEGARKDRLRRRMYRELDRVWAGNR